MPRTLLPFRALLAALLVVSSSSLPAAPQADFPLIRIPTLRDLQESTTGKSKPLLARRNGARYLFKANVPFVFQGVQVTRHGNFEGELVTRALFERLGVRAPDLYLVRVEGRRELHLRIRFAGDRFTDGETAIPQRELAPEAPVDREACRMIQLVDLLVGNLDRHEDNLLFFRRPGDSSWNPVPIDHNLALLTPEVSDQPNWFPKPFPDLSEVPPAPRTLLQVREVGNAYLSKHGRNHHPLWKNLLMADSAEADYLRQARSLAAALPDLVLEEIVRDVPDEVFEGIDGKRRRTEMLDLLQRRRDDLPAFLRAFLPDFRELEGKRREWLRQRALQGR